MADEQKRTLIELLMYKIDRTLAIAGLVALGIWALHNATNESLQVSVAVVGALAGYIGGRTGSSQ